MKANTNSHELTSGQLDAIEAIRNEENVFIYGAAGTGKTFLLDIIIEELRQARKNIVVCAMMGRVASDIGGATIHSVFNFDIGPAFTKKGEPFRHAPKVILEADVIIIDEISMVRRDLFEAIVASIDKANHSPDRTKEKNIQLVVLGDFFQLPPVITDIERVALETRYGHKVGKGFAFTSPTWGRCEFKNIELTEVIRQTDATFIKNLSKLRIGDTSCIDYFNSKCYGGEKIEDAISLYPYAKAAQRENRRRLDALNGDVLLSRIYEYGNVYDFSDNNDEYMYIKEGAKVLITCNQTSNDYVELISANNSKGTPRSGLYHNGDIGTVLKIVRGNGDPLQDMVYININGKVIGFKQHKFKDVEYTVRKGKIGKTTKEVYFQFPLVLAYAITIHRSQGMTLSAVNIDPRSFDVGQTYVAMSRCKDVDNIHLIHPLREEDVMVNKDVKAFMESLKYRLC